MITRIRYLGSAPQWGDGGPFHGWEVAAGGRWRRPDDDDAQALVGRARALLAVLPPRHGCSTSWPFDAPAGIDCVQLEAMEVIHLVRPMSSERAEILAGRERP